MVIKFLKTILILIIIHIAFKLNSIFVINIVLPTVGDNITSVLSSLLTLLITFLITYLLLPWVGKAKLNFFIATGVIWLTLSSLYSIAITALLGYESIEYLFKIYITGIAGVFWLITSLGILLSPVIVAMNRNLLIKKDENILGSGSKD